MIIIETQWGKYISMMFPVSWCPCMNILLWWANSPKHFKGWSKRKQQGYTRCSSYRLHRESKFYSSTPSAIPSCPVEPPVSSPDTWNIRQLSNSTCLSEPDSDIAAFEMNHSHSENQGENAQTSDHLPITLLGKHNDSYVEEKLIQWFT